MSSIRTLTLQTPEEINMISYHSKIWHSAILGLFLEIYKFQIISFIRENLDTQDCATLKFNDEGGQIRKISKLNDIISF